MSASDENDGSRLGADKQRQKVKRFVPSRELDDADIGRSWTKHTKPGCVKCILRATDI
jgi:hypothetical protein